MVTFENVSKKYKTHKGEIIALDDVSFHINDDEFLFLIGASGAGKSTVLRLIVREEIPSEGEIFFENLAVNRLPTNMLPLYRQQLGIVFQDLKLIRTKTIRENIRFAFEVLDKEEKETNEGIEYLLNLVHLTDRADLYPDQLSGGEKQRVAIARALASEPKFLIADEPTGNLDPDTSLEILEILKSINKAGTTVMVVTHDHDLVNNYRTRVLELKQGRLIRDEIGGYNV